MSESIIIIDTSEIREGKLGELRKAMIGVVGLADANEQRMIAYNMYLNGDSTRLTVIQVHPDSASAEFHMQFAGSAFPGFVEFIRMSGIDIYGKPSRDLLEMLQRKARMLGSGKVSVHELHAGFSRFGIQSPLPQRIRFKSCEMCRTRFHQICIPLRLLPSPD